MYCPRTRCNSFLWHYLWTDSTEYYFLPLVFPCSTCTPHSNTNLISFVHGFLLIHRFSPETCKRIPQPHHGWSARGCRLPVHRHARRHRPQRQPRGPQGHLWERQTIMGRQTQAVPGNCGLQNHTCHDDCHHFFFYLFIYLFFLGGGIKKLPNSIMVQKCFSKSTDFVYGLTSIIALFGRRSLKLKPRLPNLTTLHGMHICQLLVCIYLWLTGSCHCKRYVVLVWNTLMIQYEPLKKGWKCKFDWFLSKVLHCHLYMYIVSCKISLSIFTRIELKFRCLGERINQTFGLVPHANDDNLVTKKPVINQT